MDSRRSSWSCRRSTSCAEQFSSNRSIFRVPGIAASGTSRESTHANATCAGVAPVSFRKLYDELTDSALESKGARALETHRADSALLGALHRYLALADSHLDAQVLGPLFSKEIHYRLLMAPFGGMLRSLIRHDSNASAITRAISYIRADLRTTIAIPDLARRVGMSASSFHKNFSAVTATSPRKYQKELRLLEARRLLKTGSTSVTSAAFDVGYESASQFSREYVRKFGVPPSHERGSVASS